MKCLLFVFALSIIFSGAYSWVAFSPANPDHTGHCYSNETGQMEYGAEITIADCIRVTCNRDGSLDFAGCGLIRSPCEQVIQDLTKPYPDCCPIPDCSNFV